MLVIYTSPGCASCRKAKAWLKEKGIKFVERNIFSTILKDDEIKLLLSRTENGTEDIIAKGCKFLKDNHIDLNELNLNEFISLIRDNPSLMKRPIIIDEDNMLIGYDSEEIEMFDQEAKNNFKFECAGSTCPNYQICGKMRKDA